MTKTDDASAILADLGLPERQRQKRSALTLLALSGLREKDPWSSASQTLRRTVDIMAFMRTHYGKDYKPNSRETIRRQTLHQFEQARVIDRNPDDPARPTNSGNTCYALTAEALKVIRSYGAQRYAPAVRRFIKQQGSLQEAYRKHRKLNAVPLTLPDGSVVALSPGRHNRLQVAVVEEMGPRFTPGAQVLYVGDTANKHAVCKQHELNSLSIPLTRHDKLPDIVLHHAVNDWLILIEAVTSHGPVSPKRHAELEAVLSRCSASRVYISAFDTWKEFRRHIADIAWETEVWIREDPGHMIHFNGPKFLGPY